MKSSVQRLRTDVVLERGVAIALPDGSITRADVYRPAAESPIPTLLQQIPYGRANSALSVVDAGLEPWLAVDAGFAVVIHDVRGTGDSDGVFVPFDGSESDGSAIVDWILEQAWSDGSVVTYGTSYSGFAALAAARANHAVRATSTMLSAGEDAREDFVWVDGVRNFGFLAYWGLTGVPGRGETAPPAIDMDAVYQHLPINDAVPTAVTALWEPSPDPAGAANAAQTYVPSLTYTGWNDIFLAPALRRWKRIQSSEHAHRLIVGPWSHGNFSDSVGGVMMGAQAALAVDDATRERIAFFRDVLAGRSPSGPPVRYFVQGAERWNAASSWPPPDVRAVTLRLLGKNGASLDELLTSDPLDPIPTVSGKTYLPGVVQSVRGGPRDRSKVQRRADVLLFESAVLVESITLAGPSVIEVGIEADVETYDLVGHLCVVDPDGTSRPYADGVRRIAGAVIRPARVELILSDSAFVVPAGSKLRLELGMSDFPRYDRNPHTRIDTVAAEAEDFRPAQLRLRGDDVAVIRLPVLDAPAEVWTQLADGDLRRV